MSYVISRKGSDLVARRHRVVGGMVQWCRGVVWESVVATVIHQTGDMAGCRVSRKALLLSGLVVFAIVVAVFFALILKNRDDDGGGSAGGPQVDIRGVGALRGEWVDGAQGRGFRYAAFRGIPYAVPPVGDLRFKNPVPLPLAPSWEGVRDATKEGSVCYQSASGSEDCLYLNVYTPKLPSANTNVSLPVYVYIHGGIFQFGSGSTKKFGPDFLLQQDIIVVTMNYRLGFLGYMSLDTAAMPGNLGLKDAVEALRWVNKNIRSFGGDPSKVTLGGQSSGGISASWLSILPATKGLLRSAIIQSGTAVSSWGFNQRHVEFAETVFRLLTGRAAADHDEVHTTLMKADVRDLFYAAENATNILHGTKSLGSDISFFYLPTLETYEGPSSVKLITKDAESYIIDPETDPVPVILGETMREWAGFFLTTGDWTNATFVQQVIANPTSYVPSSIAPGPNTSVALNLAGTTDVDSTVKEIQDYYFLKNNEANCDDSCKMAKYLDQIYMMADTSHLARLRARHCPAPTYVYVFNFKSDYNADTSSYPEYIRDAVIHGDDLRYTWASDSARDYYGDGKAARALRRQVALVTNFIKEGDPTPATDELLTLRWRPVRRGEAETFLEIGDDLVQRDGSAQGADDAGLWARLFADMREGKGV